ncbi:MAG TPA: hypothetical protein VHY32_06430 [Caulobacteraceae bacterium]|jgi:hypothetical protein|nr:hypothetical protein [Caulobacteraceae bacterium]
MKKSIAFVAGMIGSLFLAGTALAEGFQQHVTECVEKFADPNMTASVMLECTAGGGKLTACKVVDNTAAGKGFDKAAICLADFLPMGTKTGTIRVPLKFQAAS